MRNQIFFFIGTLPIHMALAWGPTGHRIVASIAEAQLNSKTQKKIKEILKNEPMVEAANWPDEVRSDKNKEYFDKFLPWHYVEIPDGMTYSEAPKADGGDIVTAIESSIKTIKDKNAKSQHREALSLLIHFVGDVHQPLHVGNGKDRGGNWCFVKWFGAETNLHAVWDDHMIDHTKLSYTEWVELFGKASSEEVKVWQKAKVLDWVHESMELRVNVYPKLANGAKPYCKYSSEVRIQRSQMPSLGYDYRYEHLSTVKKRLLQAGVRLAGVLNGLF